MGTTTKRAAAKPVANTGKGKTKVTDTDPLADLGLEDAAPAAAKTTAAPVTETTQTVTATAETEHTDESSREEVDVGDLEFGFVDYIPTAKRRSEGSKYKFDQLQAPKKTGDKTQYAQFTVKLQPGVDADKLRRSVQSATTQANRQGSQAGKYFVSRSVNDDKGAFVGMQVIRTDIKPSK